jgi:membrane-associated phospholipid phosphatase
MRLLPNYEVNSIDVRGVYEAEKKLFGIMSGGVLLTSCEYFARHNCALMDFFAGVFYLCWVPVPLSYSLYLYLKGRRREYLHFSLAFLLVNLIGFCGYYIYPAAPPWYAMNYGFEPILGTPGNSAGLIRFDVMTGLPVFHSLYDKNANVFAAIPSLHAAYMLVTVLYALKYKQSKLCVSIFAVICCGIWFTAVYSGHHYIIDVLLGIFTALAGILLLECVLFHIPMINRLMKKYLSIIS